jgi:hypothetical protein
MALPLVQLRGVTPSEGCAEGCAEGYAEGWPDEPRGEAAAVESEAVRF